MTQTLHLLKEIDFLLPKLHVTVSVYALLFPWDDYVSTMYIAYTKQIGKI